MLKMISKQIIVLDWVLQQPREVVGSKVKWQSGLESPNYALNILLCDLLYWGLHGSTMEWNIPLVGWLQGSRTWKVEDWGLYPRFRVQRASTTPKIYYAVGRVFLCPITQKFLSAVPSSLILQYYRVVSVAIRLQGLHSRPAICTLL